MNNNQNQGNNQRGANEQQSEAGRQNFKNEDKKGGASSTPKTSNDKR